MFVCLCRSVTDNQIRDAVLRGAVRMRDLNESLGVASVCGKCACVANQVRLKTLDECLGGRNMCRGAA